VMAFAQGGALETVVDGVSGLFFFEQSKEAIADCIQRFESTEFDRAGLRKHAESFSKRKYLDPFKSLVNEKLEEARK